jgi:signal peptidase I
MEPTLLEGDRIAASRYWRSDPQRGHVIVFRSPAAPDEWLVKRVIAVPGDLVDTERGRIRIGRHAIAEPYARDPAQTGSIAPQIIPAGMYFVAGDNRAASYDSRHWGPVPRARIAGRARLVLWSSTARWRRVFKWIE